MKCLYIDVRLKANSNPLRGATRRADSSPAAATHTNETPGDAKVASYQQPCCLHGPLGNGTIFTSEMFNDRICVYVKAAKSIS